MKTFEDFYIRSQLQSSRHRSLKEERSRGVTFPFQIFALPFQILLPTGIDQEEHHDRHHPPESS
jgi:hypothetical protein